MTHARRRPLLLVLSVLIGSLTLVFPCSAEKLREIDRIAAVVGNEIVLLSELRAEAAPALAELEKAAAQGGGGMLLDSRRKKVIRETLEAMIDEVLVSLEAKGMQLSVTAEEVDRAIANMARENGIDIQTLQQAVEAQGMDLASYRAKLRKQILKFKVLNMRVRARVNISEAEARQYYNDQVRDVRSTGTFEGAHILFRVAQDARAAEVAAARKRAEEAITRIQSGEASFAAVARARSEDAVTAERGGSLGERRPGEIPAVLERAFFDLEVGELAGPIRTPAGYHVIKLVDREALGVQLFDEVKERIMSQLAQTEMARQERIWLSELRLRTFIDIRL